MWEKKKKALNWNFANLIMFYDRCLSKLSQQKKNQRKSQIKSGLASKNLKLILDPESKFIRLLVHRHNQPV